MNDLPTLFFETSQEWEQWLKAHHKQSDGVLLKFTKKASGMKSLDYGHALDVALCFGWIDGQSKSIDSTYYWQKFTPRRPKSMWSKRNIGKVAELTAAGKMRPAGLAEVEKAKQDGRWARAYDSPSNMTIPPDFQAALDANPKAEQFYNTLNKTNTYAILWRIQTASKPETRHARITKIIKMLNDGEKLY